MRDGLYRVHFQTPLGYGTGVVYAAGGKMWGGDAGLYYTGSYQTDGDNVTATVTTNRHTQHPGIVSVFGRDQVRIALQGVFSGDTAKFKGTAPEAPGVSFTAELKRIAD